MVVSHHNFADAIGRVAERPAVSSSAPRAYTATSVGFGAVLVGAAAMKLWGFAHPSPTRVTTGPVGLTVLSVMVESVVGVLLLAGSTPVWGRRVALTLAIGFVAVAAARLRAGRGDCGCFGPVHVYPGWTLAFDLTAACGLYATGRRLPAAPAAPHHRRNLRLVAAVTVPVAVLAGVLFVRPADLPPVVLPLDGHMTPGRPFALLPYLSPPDRADLSHGPRVAVLYDHDCARCRTYLSALAADPSAPPDIRLIDVSFDPARPRASDRFRPVDVPATVAVLAAVPVRVDLFDGNVEATCQPH